MYLRELNKDDEFEIMNMIDEFKKEKTNYPFEGIGDFEGISDYEELLKKLDLNKHIEDVIPEYVSQSSYALCDDDNHIYGILNIRYYLVLSLLRKGGNIGYAIRPLERGKGYGKLMLKLGLEICKKININKNSIYENKVLVTCRKENKASANTILANGGILEKELFVEENNAIEQLYWINI